MGRWVPPGRFAPPGPASWLRHIDLNATRAAPGESAPAAIGQLPRTESPFFPLRTKSPVRFTSEDQESREPVGEPRQAQRLPLAPLA